MYAYLYQDTNKLHDSTLFRWLWWSIPYLPYQDHYSQNGRYAQCSNFGLQPLNQSDIEGGTTIEESAQLFITIISGKGTAAQKTMLLC
jgi:anthranilate phosphoribosyltransferase